MRIVENALSISAAFLSFSFSLFFSLPPELRGLNLTEFMRLVHLLKLKECFH
jgi:hypothetical protein